MNLIVRGLEIYLLLSGTVLVIFGMASVAAGGSAAWARWGSIIFGIVLLACGAATVRARRAHEQRR